MKIINLFVCLFLFENFQFKKCEQKNLDSPIDLGFPWVYKNFLLTYKFSSIINLEILKIDKNVFVIKEIFGELFYDN